MQRSPGIVAHLIVGARPEPYLEAVLASIAGVCDHAVVNENSGDASPVNLPVISASALAASGRLTLLRTTFQDFSSARNACIDATPPAFRDGWVLFVDADEVHGDELLRMAALLPRLARRVDALDGYSRHFIGSFSWWRTIERRLCFFRFGSQRGWTGAVHERLGGLEERAVVPAVWFHYGHVVPPAREWEKSLQYSALGQQGWTPEPSDLTAPSPQRVWRRHLREVLPYRGEHPAAVLSTIAALSQAWRETFAQVDAVAAKRPLRDRLAAQLRAMNYARMLALRTVEARVRWGWGTGSAPQRSVRERGPSVADAAGERRA